MNRVAVGLVFTREDGREVAVTERVPEAAFASPGPALEAIAAMLETYWDRDTVRVEGRAVTRGESLSFVGWLVPGGVRGWTEWAGPFGRWRRSEWLVEAEGSK